MARVERDWLEDIRQRRAWVANARKDAERAEADMADLIRLAVKAQVSVTEIARAAGLSRERIYQIRDGRR